MTCWLIEPSSSRTSRLVGVATETRQLDNLSLGMVLFAKDAHHRGVLDQPSSQRIWRLKAYNQYGITSVLNVVFQVMLDAPGLSHA